MSYFPVIRGVPSKPELSRYQHETQTEKLTYTVLLLALVGFTFTGIARPDSLPGEVLIKLGEWLKLLTTPPEISLVPGIIASLRQFIA